MNRRTQPDNSVTTLGAYEAKTRFSELVARAEKGESFVVTKNGRPVARIVPINESDRERAQHAATRLLALLASQGPAVSEQEAQENWQQLKRDLEAEDDEQIDQWRSSSMPR